MSEQGYKPREISGQEEAELDAMDELGQLFEELSGQVRERDRGPLAEHMLKRLGRELPSIVKDPQSLDAALARIKAGVLQDIKDGRQQANDPQAMWLGNKRAE